MSEDIRSAVEAVTDGRKCPACGSPKIGVSELSGGGVNRFKPICADCHWTGGKPGTDHKDVAVQNEDLFRQWDKGERLAKVETVPPDVRMVAGVLGLKPANMDLAAALQGRNEKPRAGSLQLDYTAEVQNVGQPFMPTEDAERFAKGDPVPKMYKCDACHDEQVGTQIAGVVNKETGQREDYYAVPAGWLMHHPSAALFCSSLCVKTHKEQN